MFIGLNKAEFAKRSRPRLGKFRPPAKDSTVKIRRKQTLQQRRQEILKACELGTQCNTQGFKSSCDGYELHIDTANYVVPISALMSKQRVTNFYDVMDPAYCSKDLHEHSSSVGQCSPD